MALWDWLGRTAKEAGDNDVIWLSTSAKLEGLCAEAERQRQAGHLVLVAAHFVETLNRVELAMKHRELWTMRIDTPFGRKELEQCLAASVELPIFLTLVKQLRDEGTTQGNVVPADDAQRATILAAERHLLRREDEIIEQFAASLCRPVEIRFQLSMDDPLMRIFGGPETRDALKALGMTEGESIRSPQVSTRIAAVQSRVRKLVKSELPANSSEEWVRNNRAL